MRRVALSSFVCLACAATAPCFASDTPLYQPGPDWVVPATMPDTATTGPDTPPLVIYDMQQRIEKGRLWSYTDVATRIGSPEMLAQATALALPWAPDKGDLIVHELSIWRAGRRIDVLANG